MAYTYQQALNAVSRQLSSIVQDNYAAIACNLATSKVWMARDWRESIVKLPPFYLLPGQQDHGPPVPIVPTDFQGLRRAQIQQYNGQLIGPELHVAQNLNEVYLCEIPTMISYEKAKRAFRLYPRVPNSYGAPNYFVTGTYKTVPVSITNSTLNTALPLKDEYFYVWLEALRYAFYSLSGDPKAGQIVMNGPQKQATGQLATMMSSIDEAAANEGLNDGEFAIHPSRPLVYPQRSRR